MPRYAFTTPVIGLSGYAPQVNAALDELRAEAVGFIEEMVANRPAPSADNKGFIFRATDADQVDWSTGAAWINLNGLGGGGGAFGPFFDPAAFDPTYGPSASATVNRNAIQDAMDAAAVAGGGTVALLPGTIPVDGLVYDHGTWLYGPGTTLLHPDPQAGTPVRILSSRAYLTTGSISAGSKSLAVNSTAGLKVGCAIRVHRARGMSPVQRTTLSAAMLATGGATLTSTNGLNNNAFPHYLLVDNEIISYTGYTGTTLNNVQRGLFGTAAVGHNSGAAIGVAENLYSRVVGISGTTVTLEDASAVTVSAVNVNWGPLGGGLDRLTMDGAKHPVNGGGGGTFNTQMGALFQILGCNFRNTPGAALAFAQGSYGCKMIGGSVRDAGDPVAGIGFSISLFQGPRMCQIVGVEVSGRNFQGIVIDDRSVDHNEDDAPPTDNLVMGCTIDIERAASAHAGVLLGGCERNIVVGNTIRRIRYGVQLLSTQGTIPGVVKHNLVKGNVLTDCVTGVRMNEFGTGGLVTENTVVDNVPSGTTPIACVDDLTSGKNRISGNERHAEGVLVATSGLEVREYSPSDVLAAGQARDGLVALEVSQTKPFLLDSGADGTNAAIYTTNPISPTSNRAVTLGILVYGEATDPPQPTVSGAGMSWVIESSQLFGNAGFRFRITLASALDISPGSGAVTIGHGIQTMQRCLWVCEEFSGGNVSDWLRSPTFNTGADSTSMSVTLPAFEKASHGTYGLFGHFSGGALNPGDGFTELNEVTIESTRLMSQWRKENDTSVTASGGGARWGAIAAEVRTPLAEVKNLVWYALGQRFRASGTAF